MINWTKDPFVSGGLVQREFSLQAKGHQVPCVLWAPINSPENRPLVLIGHGGSQHKTAAGMVNLASFFVLNCGFCVAAIDGPIQGARRMDGLSGIEVQTEFRHMWEKDPQIDMMVRDWILTLDNLTSLIEINQNAVAWFGVSMGTAYGLPLAASDKRIKLAVLGMWSSDFTNSQRLADDAPSVLCPVFFQMKWDDQFFSRLGQIDLFERLGCNEKWLKVYPGEHVALEGEQLHDAQEFISSKLKIISTSTA